MHRRILVVALDRELFERIDPLLNRSLFAVDSVARGESGVVLSNHVAFDLMLVGYPLPDVSLELFLSAVRRSGGPCARSQLLVLAPESRLGEVRPLLSGDATLALPINDPRKLLEEVATRLLGVAPRMATRILVRLQVHLEEGKKVVMYQTENISKDGMLVRTEHLLPVRTRVGFEFLPPGDCLPVEGVAEVVRHAVLDVEKVSGLGLRFQEFRGDGRKRLLDYLNRHGAV